MKDIIKKLTQALYILAFVLVSAANGQSINELPLFGGVEKNASERLADKKFIESAVQSMGSYEKPAENVVLRGWEALSNDDIITAIKRFNQAWLLNKNNGQVYWGLAVTQAKQGKYNTAVELYEEGNKIIKNDPRFLTDYGYAVISRADEVKNKNKEYIATSDKGIKILSRAKEINPDLGAAYFYLAVAKFNRENYKEAWKNIHIANKKGYTMISKSFIEALKNKMPEPINKK